MWGAIVLFIESFSQALGESDPLRGETLLVVAFLVAGAIAIGLFFRRLVRRLRGLSAIRRFGDGEASMHEARRAQQKSNCDEHAIARFDQALVSNPHSVEALKGRGMCYSQMGEYDLAMQDFHMWVLRAPESGDAYFHRGDIWQRLDLIGLAISDYRSALRFNPSHEVARGALAGLMRDSTADRPKTIFSLAALFAAHMPADGSQPSSSETTASSRESTGGMHG